MKKLSLLILCLLVTCKVFTQNDTLSKTKYVFLTEEQAKANIKELVAYDGLKLVSAKQEERIKNLQEQNFSYWRTLQYKDSIINSKDVIIEAQDELINRVPSLKFHGYIGTQAFDLRVQEWRNTTLAFYGKASLVFRERFSFSAQFNYVAGKVYDLPDVFYTFNFEYKIF